MIMDDDKKSAFKERMRLAREAKIRNRLIANSVEADANPIEEPIIKSEPKLESIKESNGDPLKVLEYDSKQLNSFEKAFTGWAAIGIILIPLSLIAGFVYYFREWFSQNIGTLFNWTAYLGLFVGIGNIAYDVLSRTGHLKGIIRMTSFPNKKKNA